MNNTIYYALWYHFPDGEKSTNAISKDFNDLIKLHNISISNQDCLYHTYKKNIVKVTVDPIKCYIYKNNILEEYYIPDDGIYFCYSTQYCPLLSGNIDEKLIFLTKEDHEIWRNPSDKQHCPDFFLTYSVSYNIVIPDTYYEEGIMNA